MRRQSLGAQHGDLVVTRAETAHHHALESACHRRSPPVAGASILRARLALLAPWVGGQVSDKTARDNDRTPRGCLRRDRPTEAGASPRGDETTMAVSRPNAQPLSRARTRFFAAIITGRWPSVLGTAIAGLVPRLPPAGRAPRARSADSSASPSSPTTPDPPDHQIRRPPVGLYRQRRPGARRQPDGWFAGPRQTERTRGTSAVAARHGVFYPHPFLAASPDVAERDEPPGGSPPSRRCPGGAPPGLGDAAHPPSTAISDADAEVQSARSRTGAVTYGGKKLLETVNVIIADPASDDERTGQPRTQQRDAAPPGFPHIPLPQLRFRGNIDGVTYGQRLRGPLLAYSNNFFLFRNDHGRFFGPDPIQTDAGFRWSGAFSTERVGFTGLLPGTHLRVVQRGVRGDALAHQLVPERPGDIRRGWWRWRTPTTRPPPRPVTTTGSAWSWSSPAMPRWSLGGGIEALRSPVDRRSAVPGGTGARCTAAWVGPLTVCGAPSRSARIQLSHAISAAR